MTLLWLPSTVIASILALFYHRYRFKLSETLQKWTVCAIMAALAVLLLGSPGTERMIHWANASLILICAYSFWFAGGLAGAAFASAWHAWLSGDANVAVFIGYFAGGLSAGSVFRYVSRRAEVQQQVQMQLHRQARQLHLLHDISLALQRTTDIDKLLHIILTAITAGYGLGYNRAMLFLVTDEQGTLQGKVGIGSMSEEEGFAIWRTVFRNNMDLNDFIRKQHEAQIKDMQLNDLLKRMVIPPDEDSILHDSLRSKRPRLVRSIDPTDSVQRMLQSTFRMNTFAVVPLINKDKQIGLILVDNNINHHPISIEQVDAVVPLAAQASVAIENARLYDQTKQLSITDGLTGLYNQAYAQQTADRLVREAAESGDPLSVILMDIDNFKTYNDTNGHLEGNELLIQLSRIVNDIEMKQSIPCRFGGEEFVVLLPGVAAREAAAAAERIRLRVETEPFRHRESQPGGKVTLSLGVTAYAAGESSGEWLRRADEALYEAKRSGKNRVVCAPACDGPSRGERE